MAPREIGTKDTSETKTDNHVSDSAATVAATQPQQTPIPYSMPIPDTAVVGSGGYDDDDTSDMKEEANATSSKNTLKVTVPELIVVQQGTDESIKLGDGDPNSWQTKCDSLSTRFGHLFDQGLWTDCEFVGITEQPIQAHRVILAAASPVFANLLYNNPNSSITLPNIDPVCFKLVLEYIYTGQIAIPSYKMACRLYKAAHYFIMSQLENEIKKYLLEKVDIESVIHAYEFSKQFDIDEVSAKCLEMMSNKTEEILSGQELESACAETLESIFAMKNLNIESEMQLFKAAERWVQARINNTFKGSNDNIGDDNNDPPVNTDCEVTQEAKTKMRNAVKQIRFLTIDSQEFSEYNTTFLLSESDISAISLNIMSAKTYMPMPSGFSTLRHSRNFKTYNVRVSCTDDQLSSSRTYTISEDKPVWKLYLQFSYRSGRYYSKINLICGTFDSLSISAEIILTIIKVGGDSKWIWKAKHEFRSPDEMYTITSNFNWSDLKKDLAYTANNCVTFEFKIRVL